MRVLVSDTSVLVDLERGALLEAAFNLPFQLTVPDLLYERELKDHGGNELMALGLSVSELTDETLELAVSYTRSNKELSLPDCFALALAKTNNWTLLTGDAKLRQKASGEQVACHGVLWLFDRMMDHSVLDALTLKSGLQAIANHPRCRLPRSETKRRIDGL
jgi:predicted nucleic acid-binding protein